MSVNITSNILQCKLDLSKWEGYIVNFKSNNFENKLHQTVNAVSLDDLGYLSNCLYTNVDDTWKYLTLKLVLVLTNYKNSKTLIDPMLKAPVFIYQTKSYIILLND